MPRVKVDGRGLAIGAAAAGKSRRYATAIALFLALAGAAEAKPPPTNRSGSGPPPAAGPLMNESLAQRVMNEFSTCTYRRWPRKSEQFLAMFPNSPEAGRAGLALASDLCLDNGQLRFKYTLFRGALFEALYMSRFRARPAADIEHAPAIDYSLGATPETNPASVVTETALRNFADCVVRANPGAARALILSKVTSKEESAAFATLQTGLNACLSRGVELSFSRPILRGLVAEVLYRLSAAKAGLPPLGSRS